MKVDPKATMTAAAVAKAEPFKKLLAEAKAELGGQRAPAASATAVQARAVAQKPLATARATTGLQAQAHAPAVQTLQRARAQANGEAQRLGTVRAEHTQTAEGLDRARAQHTEATVEKREARIIDFIVRELTADERPARPAEPATVHHLQPLIAAGAPTPKPELPPETKAAQAVALIEKIEVFVKSQRPGLALTLNNSLGAHVEIERIGPKEIALKLVGHRGPPTAEAVSRIREELRARGLKVGALSVA